MRGENNMSQMKEQDKITARELNKMEIRNMPDREFKEMVIKIFTGIEKRVEYLNATLNKEKTKQSNQSEMKNSIMAIKNVGNT